MHVPNSVTAFVGSEPRRNSHRTAHVHTRQHMHLPSCKDTEAQPACTTCQPCIFFPDASQWHPVSMNSTMLGICSSNVTKQCSCRAGFSASHCPGVLRVCPWQLTLFTLCPLQVKYFVATVVSDLREDRK